MKAYSYSHIYILALIFLFQGFSIRSVIAQDVTFTLIDATTNQPVPGFDPISDGDMLDISILPMQLSIRANNVPPQFESVRLQISEIFLNARKIRSFVDNEEPYALFGDDQGNYNPGPIVLGLHEVEATPYTQDDAGGEIGPRSFIRITLVDSQNITFTLFDASQNFPISEFNPIPEGAIIDLACLTQFLSIRANVPPSSESVRFDFDGETGFRIENVEPYALFGDNQGDYVIGTLGVGPHTLSATAFTQSGARGEPILSNTIQFTVVESTVSYTLIDASTDQPVPGFDPIPQNAALDLAFLPSQLNIRANVTGPFESVHFTFNGTVDNVEPYALFGDNQGDYNPGSLPLGEFILGVFLFPQDNATGKACFGGGVINFTVVNTGNNITFTLIDASRSQAIPFFDPISDGDIIDILPLGGIGLSIIASVSPKFESVRFDFDGQVGFRTENVVPYSLGGDDGRFYGPVPLTLGPHSLTATAFTEDGAGGVAGPSRTIEFTVARLVKFTLVDAQLDQDIQILNYNDLLLGFELPSNLNIRADIEAGSIGETVESVRFDFDGQEGFRTENVPPYALFGDTNGDYNSGVLDSRHTVSITAFNQNGANGFAIFTSRIEFEITFSRSENNDNIPHYNYPNPFTDVTNLTFELPEAGNVQLTVFDLMGRKVTTLTDGWREAGPHVIKFDAGNAPEGIYYYKLNTLKGSYSGRMIRAR